jgi:Flp pilus assembly pilin Flp
MLLPVVSTAAVAATLRRFRRSRAGSAAVEFAIVAPMFFALVFAIIETAMVFFAGQYLETGVQDTGRLLLTSQVQAASMSKDDFKQNLCNRVAVLFACTSIDIDVQSFAAGTTIVIKDPIDTNGNYVAGGFVYQPPALGSDATVVFRAFYQWPLFVTKLGYDIANIGRGSATSKRLLAATAAFRPQ